MPSSTFNVLIGPAAIAIHGGYWIGVASGNRYCKKKRRSAAKALEDAKRLEKE